MIAPATVRPLRGRPATPAIDSLPAPMVGLGAGGHTKCLLEAIRSVHRFRVVALLDADPARTGSIVLGHSVFHDRELSTLRREGVVNAFVGIGHVGDATNRRRAAALLREAGFRLPPIVHRSATVALSATLDDGAQVMAGALVGAEAHIGRDAILNAGAIVGHDVHVGESAHLASGSRVAGSAHIGAGGLIGAGAVVIQGITVGDGAVVGAGAVVIHDVPAGVRVGGAPARPLTPATQVA